MEGADAMGLLWCPVGKAETGLDPIHPCLLVVLLLWETKVGNLDFAVRDAAGVGHFGKTLETLVPSFDLFVAK